MPELSTDVRYIKGVGEQRAKALARLGVRTLGDLLNYFPRAYEDRTAVRPIAELALDETACVRAMVAAEPRLTRVRRGLDLVKLRIVDESGSADVTFFNQSYVRDQLVPGESYVFYGKAGGNLLRKTFTNPVFEREDRAGTVTGRILPLYRLTHGISNKLVVSAVECALDACGDMLPELLPAEITEQYALPKVGFAYRNVHFPPDWETLALARRRLTFEEFFVLSCATQRLRAQRESVPGERIPTPDVKEFYAALPFSPTRAQRRAADEALRDMASGKRMSRLLQGDVGSGKTLVAAALLWAAQRAGYQSAFMAPTEILAQQHVKTLQGFLAPFGIRVCLLTGSMKAKEKSAVKAALEEGVCDVAVGTHALLTEDVRFHNLGLAVTDEQHRFGVEQRGALGEKGAQPHILVMSATPIPRTLALMIYGDLDVSVLDELPPGRQTVDTFAVTESYRARLNGFIRKQVEEGHQVFVVCPKVEDGEEGESKLKSASEHAEELQKLFPDLTVACVHGRMKPKEKEAVMAAFAAGETDILVSTTVVEVGRTLRSWSWKTPSGSGYRSSTSCADASGAARRRATACSCPIRRRKNPGSGCACSRARTTALRSRRPIWSCAAPVTSSARASTACRKCTSRTFSAAWTCCTRRSPPPKRSAGKIRRLRARSLPRSETALPSFSPPTKEHGIKPRIINKQKEDSPCTANSAENRSPTRRNSAPNAAPILPPLPPPRRRKARRPSLPRRQLRSNRPCRRRARPIPPPRSASSQRPGAA